MYKKELYNVQIKTVEFFNENCRMYTCEKRTVE